MSLAKRLLTLAFSFFTCSIPSRNFSVFSPSDIEPQNAYGRFMITMHVQLKWSHFSIFASLEVLNAKSKSIWSRIISIASLQTLKFVSFSFGRQINREHKINNILTKKRKSYKRYITRRVSIL